MVEAKGVITLKTPACDGPVAWKDRDATQKDVSRLKAALDGQEPRVHDRGIAGRHRAFS